MHSFEQYLQDHKVEPLMLSVLARVRYLTVWHAMKGKPISRHHATQIIQAATSLTGVPYTGPISLLPDLPIEQIQTMPLKRIQRY